jgi:hypothetical protein
MTLEVSKKNPLIPSLDGHAARSSDRTQNSVNQNSWVEYIKKSESYHTLAPANAVKSQYSDTIRKKEFNAWFGDREMLTKEIEDLRLNSNRRQVVSKYVIAR